MSPHPDPLLSPQIEHSLRLSEAAERHAADAHTRAHGRFPEVLKQIAAAETLRRTHQRRQLSLRALAVRETALHATFVADADRAMSAANARATHARAGEAAAGRLVAGLAQVRASFDAELGRFRAAGDELRLDVAADLAAAFRVAHGAAHLETHYAKERQAVMRHRVDVSDAQYQESAAIGDKAEARRLCDLTREHRKELKTVEDRLEELAQRVARIEQLAAAPWALLRRRALGGPAAADAAEVRVRTSAANLAAWDCDERPLERPEAWNRAMSDEADQAKAARAITAA